MIQSTEKGIALTSLIPGLAAIENRLQSLFGPDYGAAAEMGAHVVGSGGKRVRPALLLLSAGEHACRLPSENVVNAAASVEIVHTASLVHDDIMDGAGLRRGSVTLNTIWGDHTAVLAGDYLFARAFSLLASTRNPNALAAVAEGVRLMCEGQIDETHSGSDPCQTEAHYLSRIEKKTAQFLSVCCRAGAIVAGRSPQEIAAAGDYGLNLGLSFQLVDDLLDITGDPASMGKPAGSDLVGGILTLPVIHVMSRPGYRWMREAVSRPSGDIRGQILEAVRQGGGLEYTRDLAFSYTRRAVRALGGISDPFSRRVMILVARMLCRRIA